MKVELISIFGDDTTVVNCARVSYDKTSENYTKEQNDKLIKYLIEHEHTAPFRHPQLRYRVECSIYVERQLRKHEIGLEVGLQCIENMSVNSISGRYVDFSDNYTTVTEWRKQSESSKQGSDGLIERQQDASEIEEEVINFCKLAYNNLLCLGVSKEQARSILPLNLNTTFIWTGSLLSFLHIFDLRLKKDAQKETREVVEEMLKKLKEYNGNPFEKTLKYFEL
jgi:thymidylate synthase (FAD)